MGRFDGRFYQVDFTRLAHKPPLRPNLPVWVAALRTAMVRLAGRCADGLVGHPSWSVRWTLEQINGPYAEALAASGRTRDQVEINLWTVVAPNPDVAESVHDAKRHVASYASIAQYEPYFAAHGFAAEAAALQQAVGRGRAQRVRAGARRDGPHLRAVRHARRRAPPDGTAVGRGGLDLPAGAAAAARRPRCVRPAHRRDVLRR